MAEIWVSAVLYVAIGTVVLTIILAAGLPVINKLRDKNTIVQTKNAMHELDDTIRTVVNEGPGSQRLRTLDFRSGELAIDQNIDKISWKMETRFLESEPGISIKEGTLDILTEEDKYVVGKYWTKLSLDYSTVADIDSTSTMLIGRYNLLIKNEGLDTATNKIKILINEQ